MSVLSRSDQLRCELLKRRLPRYYVHRVMREIDDHSRDIAAESAGNEATALRLGDPKLLAGRFATEFRSRHFAGRHPWLVFLLGPIPCTILAATLLYMAGFFALESLGSLRPSGATSWLNQWLAIVVCYGGLIAPIVGATLWFGRWALRSGCGARWFWTATALECLLAALVHTQLRLPTAPGNGMFSVGLGFPPVTNWPLVALPILVAIGMAFRLTHGTEAARRTMTQ